MNDYSLYTGRWDRRFSPRPAVSQRTVASKGEVVLLAERLAGRDPALSVHGRVVGRYAALTARELGIPRATADSLRLAGELHDIGKLEMPRSILDKPGPLNEHEWAQIMTHPVIGATLIRDAGLDEIADWVFSHHERPDGRGYPRGLGETQIPLESSVLAVADAFHAMTTHRPYQAAIDHRSALDELRRGVDSQFDRIVVDAFVPSVQRVLIDTSPL
jgi:HD-GYP domain-containing protein (c-di-GMP phosphodiesterase class II)